MPRWVPIASAQAFIQNVFHIDVPRDQLESNSPKYGKTHYDLHRMREIFPETEWNDTKRMIRDHFGPIRRSPRRSPSRSRSRSPRRSPRRSPSPRRRRSRSNSVSRTETSTRKTRSVGTSTRRKRGRSPRLRLKHRLGKVHPATVKDLKKNESVLFLRPGKNANLPGTVCRGIRTYCRQRDPRKKRYVPFPDDGSDDDEYVMALDYSARRKSPSP